MPNQVNMIQLGKVCNVVEPFFGSSRIRTMDLLIGYAMPLPSAVIIIVQYRSCFLCPLLSLSLSITLFFYTFPTDFFLLLLFSLSLSLTHTHTHPHNLAQIFFLSFNCKEVLLKYVQYSLKSKSTTKSKFKMIDIRKELNLLPESGQFVLVSSHGADGWAMRLWFPSILNAIGFDRLTKIPKDLMI